MAFAPLALVGLFLIVLAVVFWVSQFYQLMNMTAEEFAWEYDKVLWFVVLLVGCVLGALLFFIWRQMGGASRGAD